MAVYVDEQGMAHSYDASCSAQRVIAAEHLALDPGKTYYYGRSWSGGFGLLDSNYVLIRHLSREEVDHLILAPPEVYCSHPLNMLF